MRKYILAVLIVWLLVYSRRRWLVALFGCIVIGAFNGHPDMPRAIFGVSGLSLWNLLLGGVIVLFLIRPLEQRHRWDAPALFVGLFLAYLCVMFVADARTLLDLGALTTNNGTNDVISWSGSEFLINYMFDPMKFMILPLLLYYGVRDRKWLIAGVLALITTMMGYVLIVLRNVPVSNLWSSEGFMRHRRNLAEQAGMHANDLALLLVVGFWAALLAARCWRDKRIRVCCSVAALALLTAIMMCKSRGGFIALVAAGIVCGVVCWRALLIWIPVGAMAVFFAVPSVSSRIMMGVGVTDVSGQATSDWDTITAGRTTALWPPVIDGIAESPLIGYGRLGIMHEPLASHVVESEGNCPTHPHNAYLEMLLDGGLMSLTVVMTLMFALLWASLMASRAPDPVLRTVGAIAVTAMVAYLVTGLSGKSLYFTDRTFLIWCFLALGLRAHVIYHTEQAVARANLCHATFEPRLPLAVHT